MNYTFNQLIIFSKLAETGSVTITAEQLHLTQPAISIQLKKFQDQFEIKLTEIKGRKIFLTAFGEEIALVCKRVLKEAEMLHTTMDNHMGLLSGSLSFSIVSTGKYVLPYFLKEFKDTYPKIDVKIRVTNKQQVLKSIQSAEDDYYLVSVLPDLPDIATIELMDNLLYLVGSKQEMNKLPKDFQVNDLKKLSLIYREEGSATLAAMQSYLNLQNITAQNTMELVSNEAVKQAILAGLGFSIMPLIGIKQEVQNGDIQIIELPKLPLKTAWQLVYNTNRSPSPVNEAFIDYIEARKHSIIKQNF